MRFYVHFHNSGYYRKSSGMTLVEAKRQAHEWVDIGGARLAEITRGIRGYVIATFLNAPERKS